jgi:hypothetical protein
MLAAGRDSIVFVDLVSSVDSTEQERAEIRS